MPWWRTSSVWLCGWLAIAFAARFGAAIVVEQIVSATPGRLCLIEGDADGYWQLAGKIVRGEDYVLYDPPRWILRMPGFPVLLAGSRLIFGDAVFPARLLLCVIGTLTCVSVYWLACELCDKSTALVACAAVSLSPPLIAFTPLLLTETTFALLLITSLIPIVRLLRAPWRLGTGPIDSASQNRSVRWGWVSAAGLLIALATYIRPTWLPVSGVVALALWIQGRGRKAAWLEAGIVLATCGLLLLPWVWRNYTVCGHLVPTTLWVGPSLYDGLNPEATGDSDMRFFDRENLLATMSEYEMDQTYRRRAWAYAAEHPQRAVELAVIKAGRYWSPWPNAAQFNAWWVRWGLALSTLPCFGLALAGLWIYRRDSLLIAATWGPAVFFCIVHMLFVGSIRYRLPADYALWIAASAAATAIARRSLRFPSSPDAQRGLPWAG